MARKTIAGLEVDLGALREQRDEARRNSYVRQQELEKLKKQNDNLEWELKSKNQELFAAQSEVSLLIGIIIGTGNGSRLVEHEAIVNNIRANPAETFGR